MNISYDRYWKIKITGPNLPLKDDDCFSVLGYFFSLSIVHEDLILYLEKG